MEAILMIFGTFFYMVSAVVSSYIACIGKIDHSTNWIGKAIVYYGIFNIAYWACMVLLLVTLKVGYVLLG